MSKLIDLSNHTFGRLYVLERAPDYIQPNGRHRVMWKCQCQCKNKTLIVVSGEHLKTGHTTSCGCVVKEVASKLFKKFNDYDLSGEYGIGWTSNTRQEFYFDIEDYALIKKYCWREDVNHYIVTNDANGHIIFLHRLVMGADKTVVVDHKEHKTYDNRKQFLRIGTQSNNMMNATKRKEVLLLVHKKQFLLWRN